jgi:hypothetical protein
MHSWHIVKPHLHLQLKTCSFLQQWQVRFWALRRLDTSFVGLGLTRAPPSTPNALHPERLLRDRG